METLGFVHDCAYVWNVTLVWGERPATQETTKMPRRNYPCRVSTPDRDAHVLAVLAVGWLSVGVAYKRSRIGYLVFQATLARLVARGDVERTTGRRLKSRGMGRLAHFYRRRQTQDAAA